MRWGLNSITVLFFLSIDFLNSGSKLFTIVINRDIESIVSRESAQSDDELRDDFIAKLNHALSHVFSPVSA